MNREMNQEPPDFEPPLKSAVWAFSMVMLAIGIWIIVGFAAFIASIVCIGRTGTTSQHVIGLVLSALFGPFYWIYFFVSKDYCKSKSK